MPGVPEVAAVGQGGLLDVVLDRGFANNKTIYFCFTYESGGNAAIARAKLGDTALSDMQIIFRQQGPGGSNNHGCRIAQQANQLRTGVQAASGARKGRGMQAEAVHRLQPPGQARGGQCKG